jgi:nitroimidazol reductase NimA-like FMN-containing flavoprotein (pyridoxamine 5'-phosphate oxidase superfamily)
MRITKMEDGDCRDALRRLGFGRLGCAHDNQPYIVPIYFAYEADHLYGFATFGQKVEWMRSNPLVCIQSDELLSNDNWSSIIALGRYEELPDTPDYARERGKAQSLLEKRSMWWQTSYMVSNVRGQPELPLPVFFRVRIKEISGLRASPEGGPVRIR